MIVIKIIGLILIVVGFCVNILNLFILFKIKSPVSVLSLIFYGLGCLMLYWGNSKGVILESSAMEIISIGGFYIFTEIMVPEIVYRFIKKN